ncbi:MAG: hypothetical protein WCP69_13690 [Bacteroidota bacterium]
MKNKLIQAVLVIAVVILSVLIYRSIIRPEKYRIIAEDRKAIVVEQMKDIRTAQIAYKSVKGLYANDFDQLMTFLTEGRMPIVIKTGTVPDSLTEIQALKKGIVKRDTVFVDAFKEIFKDKPNIDIKKLPIIPFSDNQKFEMSSDTINKGNIKVPVFKVIAPKAAYLKGIDNELTKKSTGLSALINSILFSNLEKQFEKNPKYFDLIMGSLQEPSTDGNWE